MGRASLDRLIHRHRIADRRRGLERTVRVWLPPMPPRAVLYMHDGQHVLAEGRSRRPRWRAHETALDLIERGWILPLAIVGIDHGGPKRRWRDYLPYPDPRNPRASAFEADRYADFVVRTVLPQVARLHPELARAEHIGIGGASYGAVAALHAAARHPGTFDRLLLESPVLWVGDGRLMADAGSVPVERVFIGVGTREARRDEVSAELVRLARGLARGMRERMHVRLIVGEDAPHHERAWAERLPRALRWLFPASRLR